METILTETQLNEFLTLNELVEERILEVSSFVRDHDLRQTASFRGGYDSYIIVGNDIEAKFSESWSYGGYDEYTIRFPISYLTKSYEEIGAILERTNTKIIQEREERKLEAEKEAIKHKKAQLKQLQKELKGK